MTARSVAVALARALAVALTVAHVGVACAPAVDVPPPATFTEIYDRFFPVETLAQCNKCHSNPPNDISNGLLSMGTDPDAAYAALFAVVSTSSRCGGASLIVAGDPEASLFFTKTAAEPGCGGRMPLGGTPFNDDERAMIHSWIAAGAEQN